MARQGDLQFAQTAIALGFIDNTKLQLAQSRQAFLSRQNKKVSLSQCMMDLNFITETQVEVIRDQHRGKARTTEVMAIVKNLRRRNSLDKEVMPGTKFNRYKIIREIGRGSMAVVYKAYDPHLDRIIALKILTKENNEKDTERFLREIKATAKLQHPNIVTVHDIGEEGGKYYCTMDFVEGITLKELMKQNTLTVHQIVKLIAKIGNAIHYAHTQGVIHRDLKPSNILLNKYNMPKVTDFGVVKVTYTSKKLTETGMVIGTLQYMPPEQASGRLSEIDARSDVYALGAMLYEMITGKPVLDEKSLPLPETLEQIQKQDPIPPSRLRSKIAEELENICFTALQKDKSKRFQSVAEFVVAISMYAKTQRIDLSASNIQLIKRRHHLALIAVCILALSAVATVYWYKKNSENSQGATETNKISLAIASPVEFNQEEIIRYPSTMWKLKIIGEIQGKDIERVLLAGKQISFDKDNRIFSDEIQLHYGNNNIDLLILDKDGEWFSRSWKVIREAPNTSLILSRGDLQNTGAYKSREILGARKEQLWKSPQHIASLVVDNNSLYCGSEDYHLHFWNVKTKKLTNSFKTSGAVHSTPIIYQDILYFGSDDGYLYAVDGQGKELWKFTTQGAIWASPTAVGNGIYFGSFDGYFYAVNIETKSLLWKYRSEDKIVSAAAIYNDKICFASSDSFVYCVQQNSGNLLWKFQTRDKVLSSPVISENTVFVASYDQNIYALQLENGKKLWNFQSNGKVASSPAVFEDKIYLTSRDSHLYCLQQKTGKLLWKYQARGSIYSSPLIINQAVHFACLEGNVYAIDVVSGKPKWIIEGNQGVKHTPVVFDGVLYVVDLNNFVFAIR